MKIDVAEVDRVEQSVGGRQLDVVAVVLHSEDEDSQDFFGLVLETTAILKR